MHLYKYQIYPIEWIIDLRNKLYEFLSTLYSTDGPPVLCDMYHTYINHLNIKSQDGVGL